jgi:hypothetical protein
LSRRENGRFSQTDAILQNMYEFNENYFKYLNEIGIPLKKIVYDEIEIQNFDEIAKLGYSKYKSFTKYTLENTSEDQHKLIRSTKGDCLTAYDYFLKKCLPYIYIKHNKDNYFNVNILKNGKYTTERGASERLIYFAEGLETKYQIENQEVRSLKTIGSLKLKDIMPNVTCDVSQSSDRGKKTVLALQFLNDLYDLTFQLFKDEIVAPLISTQKNKPKKSEIRHLNDYDQILFKDKFYAKKTSDDGEKKTSEEVIEFTVFDLKLLGKPDNNLQTLITNYNEQPDNEQMMVNGKSINLDNIDRAFLRGTYLSTFINMESITYIPLTKHLHWHFKCYQIDVDNRYISKSSSSNGTFNFKGLCKNNDVPIFNHDSLKNNKYDQDKDEKDDDFSSESECDVNDVN